MLQKPHDFDLLLQWRRPVRIRSTDTSLIEEEEQSRKNEFGFQWRCWGEHAKIIV
jgi:hypothetical protein